uniref:centrosomal AT-AC splicing factor n=1 Tax=Euleptes europaea TaxID=460621 RepID=UPI0025414BA2|nr:centrosomal AT-AC splicing factor [Euleptes europaea]
MEEHGVSGHRTQGEPRGLVVVVCLDLLTMFSLRAQPCISAEAAVWPSAAFDWSHGAFWAGASFLHSFSPPGAPKAAPAVVPWRAGRRRRGGRASGRGRAGIRTQVAGGRLPGGRAAAKAPPSPAAHAPLSRPRRRRHRGGACQRQAPPPEAPWLAEEGARRRRPPGSVRPGGVPMATAAAPFRCPLCRRSAFSGRPRRSHLYSAGHQRRLRAVLARLREKVAAARETLRRAQVVRYDPSEHDRPFWCPCCRREARRHLAHGARAALHAGLLEHVAGPEHKKAVHSFWWENKADPNLKSQFLISSEDYELFKASLTKALDTYEATKEEVIQQMAAHIRKVEESRREMVQAVLEPQTETEQCEGIAVVKTCTGTPSDFSFAMEENAQPGPSGSATSTRGQLGSPCRTMLEPDWQEPGQPLTFIGHQETQGKGNVHTGAKPPWLLEEEEENSKGQIGPSYEEFLKEKEKQKLKKLPPDRVGANFDHTSQTGEGWLPSFGRVWNHGRRWQSRHQFKAEEGQKKPKRKKRQVP